MAVQTSKVEATLQPFSVGS